MNSMKIYFSQTIGDGATIDSSFRAIFSDYCGVSSVIDARRDASINGLTFVITDDITTQEHNAAIQDNDIDYFDTKGLSLNSPISSLDNLSAKKTWLENHQIPVDGLTANSAIKQLLRRIVKRFLIRRILLSDDFTDNIDGTITTQQKQRIKDKLIKLGFNVPDGMNKRELLRHLMSTPNEHIKARYVD